MSDSRIFTQVNLEYVAIENRVISTEQDAALQDVFGDGVGSAMYKQSIMTSARRLATVFATLKVYLMTVLLCCVVYAGRNVCAAVSSALP